MDSLNKLQAEFADAVFGHIDESADYGIAANGISAARRLQVYKNNMFTTLTEALIAIYPVVYRLVGEEFFRFIAKKYIPLHPSRSGNLHDFGGRFPEFLDSLESVTSLPYLPDVASLEWAYHQVFHAAYAPPLDLEPLQKLPAEYDDKLYFKLHPACRLVRSDYPIVRIWQSNQKSHEGDDLVSLKEGGVALAVIRPQLDIEFHLLSAGDFALLNAINEGTPFFKACEQAVQEEADLDLAMSLYRHTQNNIIVDFFVIQDD